VKDAYFYTKDEPWNAKKGNQVHPVYYYDMHVHSTSVTSNMYSLKIPVSALVRPKVFELSETWTYGSPSKYDEVVK
jgi:hypothetical protein